MLEILAVIAAIVLGAVAVFYVIKNRREIESEEVIEVETYKAETKPITKDDSKKTCVFSDWSICELDENGSVIAKKEIDLRKCDTDEGFSIGRSKSCDFPLTNASKYLSSIHARIGYDHDAKVFFLMDNDSTNGIFYKENRIESFDITVENENEVVYLSDVPICFQHNTKQFLVNRPKKEFVETEVQEESKNDFVDEESEVRQEQEVQMVADNNIKPLKRK